MCKTHSRIYVFSIHAYICMYGCIQVSMQVPTCPRCALYWKGQGFMFWPPARPSWG